MRDLDLKLLLAWPLCFVLVESGSAQLVAFVASEDAPGTTAWQTEQLAFLSQLAQEQGTELRVVDVSTDGAPPEVGITPLLVFQNHRGRSIYQGRSSNRTRIENFVQTASVIHQSDEPWVRTDIAVFTQGRAKVAAPFKITGLAGDLPEDYDANAFAAESEQAILSALEHFELRSEVQFGRSDRTFYFDFYPYRNDSGQFFVSVALFSQFHCKEPIYQSDEALVGEWSERAAVLARAARSLERQTLRLIRESKLGDGFDCVPEGCVTKSFEELGLELPAPPEGVEGPGQRPELVRNWHVSSAREKAPPRVLFHFPAPLDGTAGRADTVLGHLVLGANNRLEGASGKLVVETNSISLGVDDLDDVVRSKAMLDVEQYPQASFSLDGLRSQEGQLAFGEQARTVLFGRFEMKGRTLPIEVSALWEPIVNAAGEPRLLVDGAFSIRLKETFGINGPDGPSPQRDTLLFHFALELVPGA